MQYSYDAWGDPSVVAGSGDQWQYAWLLGYRGYQYDKETGLNYCQSRYYNPRIARWLNAEDIDILKICTGDNLELNAFTYCINNPITNRDENGYFFETLFDIASILWSAWDYATNPTWANAGFLAWDIAAAIIPYMPGSYSKKGLSVLAKEL